ncbi:MAG: glycoside hydrolase family 127 protein [Planctomycetia bacterium]|nr:glycoside hydrolase family 127 protein [Planctomycetia bacterium]
MRVLGWVLLGMLGLGNVLMGQTSQEYSISPVLFTSVEVPTGFWKPRLDACREVTIPFSFKKCEETGRISNFAKAGGLEEGKFQGIYFDDSDLYKVIEGAAYVLALRKDEALDKYLDGVIAKIAAAQEPDGYLYTSRTIYQKAENKEGQYVPPGGNDRWTSYGGHELYCVGHLYEAAVAHYQATGKRNLLDVALKSADLICETFGFDKAENWAPGHEEIEIGLAKLYRLTGEKKYLEQAKYFLDVRGPQEGRKFNVKTTYNQEHLPVVEQKEAVGHAVRALYLYSGMADIAALTGDKAYNEAIHEIWKDVVERKIYVTGGLGAIPKGEAFGAAYELPNDTAYCETCAAIAGIYWNHRLFLDSGESKYIDVLEKILYNAMLSGVSMSGDRFFYPNVLCVKQEKKERSPWFGCSCCPSNVCRFLASMPGYLYAVKGKTIYVNLYSDSKATVKTSQGDVVLEQKTNYPWDGKIQITVHTPGEYTLKCRVPGWARGEAIPGEEKLYTFLGGHFQKYDATQDGYLTLTRNWKAGETVELDFPMEILRVVAHEKVEADRGRVALQRGPIVYCVEQQDTSVASLQSVLLKDETPLTTAFEPEMLGGIQVIRGTWSVLGEGKESQGEVPFTAIPYYAWAHREARQMTVWIPRQWDVVEPLTFWNKCRWSASRGDASLLMDGSVPKDEKEWNHPRLHWWPAKGSQQWLQCEFPCKKWVRGTSIWWFDDTGRGECRVPQSWKVLYREGETWKPVAEASVYGVAPWGFNDVTFQPVETDAIRVEIQSQPQWAGGVYEWKLHLEKR